MFNVFSSLACIINTFFFAIAEERLLCFGTVFASKIRIRPLPNPNVQTNRAIPVLLGKHSQKPKREHIQRKNLLPLHRLPRTPANLHPPQSSTRQEHPRPREKAERKLLSVPLKTCHCILSLKEFSDEESEGSLKDFIDDDDEEEAKSTSGDSDSDSKSDSDTSIKSDDKKSRKTRVTRATAAAAGGIDEIAEENENKPVEWWEQFLSSDDLEDVTLSGKLFLLFEILRQCEAIGDKMSVEMRRISGAFDVLCDFSLVFSQSLYSLNVIEYFLQRIDDATQNGIACGGFNGSWTLGLDYFRIDGSSSCDNRAASCRSFNDPDNIRARFAFLVSAASSAHTSPFAGYF